MRHGILFLSVILQANAFKLLANKNLTDNFKLKNETIHQLLAASEVREIIVIGRADLYRRDVVLPVQQNILNPIPVKLVDVDDRFLFQFYCTYLFYEY